VSRNEAENLVDKLDQNGDGTRVCTFIAGLFKCISCGLFAAGLISFEELVCFKEFRFINGEVDAVVDSMQTDFNKADQNAIAASLRSNDSPASDAQLMDLRRRFEEFDTDGSGQITRDELIEGVKVDTRHILVAFVVGKVVEKCR